LHHKSLSLTPIYDPNDLNSWTHGPDSRALILAPQWCSAFLTAPRPHHGAMARPTTPCSPFMCMHARREREIRLKAPFIISENDRLRPNEPGRISARVASFSFIQARTTATAEPKTQPDLPFARTAKKQSLLLPEGEAAPAPRCTNAFFAESARATQWPMVHEP
jgi:hypothetical protein